MRIYFKILSKNCKLKYFDLQKNNVFFFVWWISLCMYRKKEKQKYCWQDFDYNTFQIPIFLKPKLKLKKKIGAFYFLS